MSALAIYLFAFFTIGVGAVAAAGLKCDAVRPYFEAQGFPASDIPREPISCEYSSIFVVMQILYTTFEIVGEFFFFLFNEMKIIRIRMRIH